MDTWTLLYDVVLLLAASLLAGTLLSRLGQSPLVGYLLAGMLLGGPGSFNLIRSELAIEGIAELGVSLLLFSLGLEFSPKKLKGLSAHPLIAATLQVLVTTVLGTAAGWLANLPLREAIAVGAMISLSSTAVVLRLLMERGETDSLHGRCGIAILLVQDLLVLPLAMLMVLLGDGGPNGTTPGAGRTLVFGALLVVGLYVAVNQIAARALKTLTLDRNRELTIILAVVIGLGSAWGAHAAGIPPALGALIAGMFLGSSTFATQIRADISPLRVVLLTLFFSTAGMVADPLWIVNNILLVVGVSVALLVGKAALTAGILALVGNPARVAIAGGICLAQIGEFAFVLGGIGRANGALTDSVYLLIVSVTIVTLMVSPLLVSRAPALGGRIASGIRRTSGVAHVEPSRSTHEPEVVIIGFGPAGQTAGQALADLSNRVLVIDLNHDGLQRARQQGFSALVGDATQLDVLEQAGVAVAKAVVITIPHHHSAMRILQQVRRLAPHVHVVVRSRYQRHTGEYVAAGAHAAFGDEEEIGDRLGRHLRDWITSRSS